MFVICHGMLVCCSVPTVVLKQSISQTLLSMDLAVAQNVVEKHVTPTFGNHDSNSNARLYERLKTKWRNNDLLKSINSHWHKIPMRKKKEKDQCEHNAADKQGGIIFYSTVMENTESLCSHL